MLMDAPRGLSDSLFNLRRAPLSDMKLPVATTSAFLLCLAATMAIVVVASPVRRRHELAPEEVERANVEIEAMPQLRELYDSFQIRDNVDGQVGSTYIRVLFDMWPNGSCLSMNCYKMLYMYKIHIMLLMCMHIYATMFRSITFRQDHLATRQGLCQACKTREQGTAQVFKGYSIVDAFFTILTAAI